MKLDADRHLQECFQASVKPQAESLTTDTSLEASMIRSFLGLRTWQELTPDVLDDYGSRGDLSALPCFLSASGFVYFAPAFMRYALQRGSHAGLLLDTLVAAFSRHAEDMRRLPQAQRDAVQSWLERMKLDFADDPLFLQEIEKARAALT
ncbi:MAG: hypothetical protein HC793_00610 [Aquincola sp.]|nr:hypothetical protein [Aquincola sp.]